MKHWRGFRIALLIAAVAAPIPALANTIDGWIANSFAEEILAGVPDAPRVRIAVQTFAAKDVPIAPDAANQFNASLLSALIRKSGGRHVFVARGALKSLVRDVSQTAVPRPRDSVETLLEKARADVLVIGTLRRAGDDMVLSYKAVATRDGAVLASTKAQRFRIRDSDVLQAALNLDQALSAATRYLMQRVDGLEEIRIGDIRYRSETAETPFSHYLRDRVADEFRRGATGVLSASGLRVRSDGGGEETGPGVYRLIGTYWPLGRSVELSLSLRDREGVAVTWRERIRTDSIPASLALGPQAAPAVESAALPWQRAAPSPAPRRYPTRVVGRETVAEAQRLLHALGYEPGPVDGILTPQTRRAIAAFQRNNGLGTDGRMTRALVASLRTRSR